GYRRGLPRRRRPERALARLAAPAIGVRIESMNVTFVRLARFGTALALAVVMLGAWVRLHDAGLGCPDWPGCYGRLVVPDQSTSLQELGPQGAVRALDEAKAWREMIHRYLAGALVLVSVALAVLARRNRNDPAQPWRRPVALVAL